MYFNFLIVNYKNDKSSSHNSQNKQALLVINMPRNHTQSWHRCKKRLKTSGTNLEGNISLSKCTLMSKGRKRLDPQKSDNFRLTKVPRKPKPRGTIRRVSYEEDWRCNLQDLPGIHSSYSMPKDQLPPSYGSGLSGRIERDSTTEIYPD